MLRGSSGTSSAGTTTGVPGAGVATTGAAAAAGRAVAGGRAAAGGRVGAGGAGHATGGCAPVRSPAGRLGTVGGTGRDGQAGAGRPAAGVRAGMDIRALPPSGSATARPGRLPRLPTDSPADLHGGPSVPLPGPRYGDPVTDPSRVPVPPADVLVVGGGLAALRTVAALREHGYDAPVRLLGAEGVLPYDRPPLSKHLHDRTAPAWLADDLGHDLHALADDVHLARPARGLRPLPGGGAVVSTDDGDVTAACVVLATGAHAVRVPRWDGRTLHTAADADALRAALAGGPRRLVVVGAGWIGAEVAGVSAAAGHEVEVVEARRAPLAAALGEAVGALTTPWYAAAGVDLRTSTPVAVVDASGVQLADGTRLAADAVLVAVGARPATAWLGGALPLRDGAVPVDESYRVLGATGPLPGLLAVGDVAVRRSARHGWVPGGHWDEALHGPDVLVRRLLGLTVEGPEAVPYVFSTQLGHDLTLFGLPAADDTVTLLGDPAATGWTALWSRGATVTGALVVDRPRDVGAARRLFARDALPRLTLPATRDLPEDLRALLRASPAG